MADSRETKHDPDVVLAVVLDGDRVLMLKRRDNADFTWVFPGGKVSPGESPESAAKRELYEEAGIRCDISRSLGTRIHPDTNHVIRYFLCVPEKLEPRLREPHLFSDMSWMTLGELEASIKTNLYPPVKSAISYNAKKYARSRL
jgi:8-oxo-dGTP diphosphatase